MPGFSVRVSSCPTVQPQVVDTLSITRSLPPKLRIRNFLLRVLPGSAAPKSNEAGSIAMRGPLGLTDGLGVGAGACPCALPAHVARITTYSSDFFTSASLPDGAGPCARPACAYMR